MLKQVDETVDIFSTERQVLPTMKFLIFSYHLAFMSPVAGMNPLEPARIAWSNAILLEQFENSFHFALNQGDSLVLKKMLKSSLSSAYFENSGNTPLFDAAKSGHSQIVKVIRLIIKSN